jgi:CRISPR system Cascade subunit CasD
MTAMSRFLLLKLVGPMQAWGDHTLETCRPVRPFPTRSGLVGLLGACLGIDGQQRAELCALDASFRLAVRADQDPHRPYGASIITDFHTVSPVRRADGQLSPYPLVTRREYLCDASFTVALAFRPDARFRHKEVVAAVNQPRYTPYLGRRSCPLVRPLLEAEMKALRAHAQRRYRALYGKKAPKLTLDQALMLALDLVPWQEPQATMPLFAVGVEIDAEEYAVFWDNSVPPHPALPAIPIPERAAKSLR